MLVDTNAQALWAKFRWACEFATAYFLTTLVGTSAGRSAEAMRKDETGLGLHYGKRDCGSAVERAADGAGQGIAGERAAVC
jgi:hypothetical protein